MKSEATPRSTQVGCFLLEMGFQALWATVQLEHETIPLKECKLCIEKRLSDAFLRQAVSPHALHLLVQLGGSGQGSGTPPAEHQPQRLVIPSQDIAS